MKNYILIAAIAVSAIAALGGGYYYYLQNSSASITVMYDITDPTETTHDTSDVPMHIAQYTSEWGATSVRFLAISDFKKNKASVLSIPAAFPLTSNPYARKRSLQAANQSILKEFNDLIGQDTGRTQSIVYLPIAAELNRLATSGAHTKELIVYSDLQENDKATFSSYRDADTMLLQKDHDKIQALFEKEIVLGNLKGITLYFVFDAKTPSDQDHFLVMAHLWEHIFMAHGIDKVIISPNLPTN